jgi:hypothetical protein
VGLGGLSCDVDRDVCPSLLIDKSYLSGLCCVELRRLSQVFSPTRRLID